MYASFTLNVQNIFLPMTTYNSEYICIVQKGMISHCVVYKAFLRSMLAIMTLKSRTLNLGFIKIITFSFANIFTQDYGIKPL